MTKAPATTPRTGRPPSPSSKGLPVSLRLPPDVKAAATRAAGADALSMSAFLEKLLTDHLRLKGYLDHRKV